MIQVGQVLDKYELLERVGQGGMAVVYRGIDRSLKRVVAVKILHKHLSDYQEARDRFEREAQAVAKLRHENILEIFDYSGSATAEELGSSYIVTEFIDGHTLKQVIVDRPITFPEIGAMIVLQVCRALSHAHHVGILHRDVKPENVMVRSDGVVKLMDFGISHMVDLERLTVTGQLLGSPAYMAPEHVEGRPLDFRTDVFAAGIVLYQLTVGKLPFEGKNPHEVLKRIAECKFVDPRQANPQIGNRLGKIILRAMAAAPDHRYAAIGEMVIALEGYLDESGIAADKAAGELARYFKGPAAYEQALETRLVETLTQRGQQLLRDDNRAAALDVFDRVLTIEPGNERVIAILDGINRRRRLRGLLAGVAAAAAIVGGAVAIDARASSSSRRRSSAARPSRTRCSCARASSATRTRTRRGRSLIVDAAPADALPPVTAAASDAPREAIDAAAAAAPAQVVVRVTPARGSTITLLDGGETFPVDARGMFARTIERDTAIRVKNDCCVPEDATMKPGQPELSVSLRYKAGAVIARCDWPNVEAKLGDDPSDPGRLIGLGERANVFFEGAVGNKRIAITFTTNEKSVTLDRRISFGQTLEVSCHDAP
ncbi:MAG: serine/threonine protein kinase [Deltaproteobacteria bacterium]|nr:serine/threonine protein kinase [Deltaproteobacteria bacterium]